MTKRLLISILTGALLGVFCVVGANLRYGGELSSLYIFSFWFNRVLIGVVIGLLPVMEKPSYYVLRGLLVGLFVSFAFYSSTDFLDVTGFLAGGVYGIITEFVAKKLA